MNSSQATESFRGLLLRHRGRTGLIQRDLAARVGVSVRSVQDWEAGVTLPTAERLQGLIRALLEVGGLTAGRETSEARDLWAVVEREAPRMHTSFDQEWFAGLLAAHTPAAPGNALRMVLAADPGTARSERAQDWGEAPDTLGFVGRTDELALLRRWVLEEGCQLVAVLGFGGIGKTSLAARIAQEVAPSFERVYWRSLRHAPTASEWLAGAIGFLTDQHQVPPPGESERIAVLLQSVRARRCLLVLDNSETLFEAGQQEGRYRPGMDAYGQVLQAIGETSHQSCLMLTSREAPPELAVLGGRVRELELHGLGTAEAQALLADKQLNGDTQAWISLVYRYGGNGLALKIMGETIRQVYDGDVATFLGDATTNSGTVFGGVRRLLETQVERLSPVEHDVLTRLAVEREPIGLLELARNMEPSLSRGAVIDAIDTLRRRSLVERGERGATFTLQSMVLEYVTDWSIETAGEEIDVGQPEVPVEQPIGDLATEYLRPTKERLSGAPILQPGQRTSLYGRARECAVLDGLVADIRRSKSRSIVVQGDAGIGKTALLEYLVESATDLTVVRAVGVESEMELPFASLHQLCRPMLDRLERLHDPQRQALEIVFGLSAGSAPDRFLVGLAVLSLFSEVARERPLLCVVDDAQWLDQASALTLAFVARRLLAEPVGVVFAARVPGEELAHMPDLEVRGLADADARALLGSAVRFKLDERVRDRIVEETRGNPLALLELPRGLTATQLAGGFGLLTSSPRVPISLLAAWTSARSSTGRVSVRMRRAANKVRIHNASHTPHSRPSATQMEMAGCSRKSPSGCLAANGGCGTMDVPALANLLRETAEHHDPYEKSHPPHNWWDWYAPYMHARQHGNSPEEASAAAGRYMEELRNAVPR